MNTTIPSPEVVSRPAVAVLDLEAGEPLAVVGEQIRLLRTSENTGGSCAVWREIVPPGGGPPPHIHHAEDEVFVILDGELTFWSEHGTWTAGAGAVAFAPRGVAHTFKNNSGKPARMVVMVTPGGFEDFLRESAAPHSANRPVFPPTADDIARAFAAAPRHGLEFIRG